MAEERDMVRQNSFSRSLANDSKAGAYYTNVEMCNSISTFFSFPEKEDVCALEPSIGDGAAIKAVMSNCSNAYIFGVELQTEVARKARESIEACLDADFLSGVRISHAAFSFCFSNPPYGEDVAKHERYERQFLDKLTPYLKAGARLVYVIPLYVLQEEAFMRFLLARFTVEHVYKFREPEFSKFKQVAIFATKKHGNGYLKEDLEKLVKAVEDIKDLPVSYEGEKIQVLPSRKEDISQFSTVRFDPDSCDYVLRQSPALKTFGERLRKPAYNGNEIKAPIIPLNNDMYYLLAISGAGQGLAGSVEEKDLHLQRGCVKRVTSQETQYDESGQSGKIVERTYSAITLTILEQSGKVTRFGDTVPEKGGN